MANLTLPTTLATPEWLAGLPGAGALPELLEQALNSPAHRERWKYTKPAPFVAATQRPMIDPDISGKTQTGVELNQSIDGPLEGFDLNQAPEAIARLCYADRVMTLDVSASTDEPVVINHTGNTRPVIIRVGVGVNLTLLENAKAIEKELLKSVTWFKDNNSFKGIDLLNDEIEKDFNKLNLDRSFYLHKSYCEVK